MQETNKKYDWLKVAESIEELGLAENKITEVTAAGKTFCISFFKEQLFACAAKCPHAGGVMSNGYVDAAGNIVCPLHRYKFSLQNGRNTSGEGYYLKTWPVEKREDGIYIGIEKRMFF